MKIILFKILSFFFLIILLFTLGFTYKLNDSLPKYNNAKLEKSCDDFLQSLDPLKITRDYPKVVQNLLSVNPEKQITGLRTLSETKDPSVIPWIIPLLDSDNTNVKVYAGLALEKLVSSYTLRRRDIAYPDKIVLKPLGKNDKDLRPLAWIILNMLRKPDDGNTQAYAATMIGYLNLTYFDDDLRQLLKSEHPAVVQSAQWALGMLGAGKTIKQEVSTTNDEYKVYSDALSQLAKMPTGKDVLVIRQKTTLCMDTKFDEKDKMYLKKNFGEMINDDLIREFATVNSKRVILQNMFSNNLNVILISKEEKDRIFNPADGGWKRFYSKYPKSFGIIELSRVAFNANKTKALLYYGSSFASGKGGIGYYILLKKQNDEWIIQKKVMRWIA